MERRVECERCSMSATGWSGWWFDTDKRTHQYALKGALARTCSDVDCPYLYAIEALSETHGMVSKERAPHQELRRRILGA